MGFRPTSRQQMVGALLIDRVDDTPAHEVLREAIANGLTNTNWFERCGVVCVWSNEAITIANPGDFSVSIEEVRQLRYAQRDEDEI